MSARMERLKRTAQVHAAGAIALAGIGAAAYVFGVAPYSAASERAHALRMELTERSREESDLRKRQREAEVRLRTAEVDLRERGVTLRAPEELNAQVQEIAKLAKESGLEVDTLVPNARVGETQFARLPVRLTGRATPVNASSFMRMVRERFPDVTVRTFDVRAEVTTPGAIATVQMELDWYTLQTGP